MIQNLAPVDKTVDNAMCIINASQMDNAIGVFTYLHRDFSVGIRCPSFEELSPE